MKLWHRTANVFTPREAIHSRNHVILGKFATIAFAQRGQIGGLLEKMLRQLPIALPFGTMTGRAILSIEPFAAQQIRCHPIILRTCALRQLGTRQYPFLSHVHLPVCSRSACAATRIVPCSSASCYKKGAKFAGIGIPILAALNAALGGRIGSPVAASVVLFAIAFLSAAAVYATGMFKPSASLLSQPKHFFLAGLLIAFYVLSITFIAPKFGVGNAVFFVLLGQLISAAMIDHFGLFGAQINPLSITKSGGIFLMVAGVYLTQQA